MSLRAQRGNLAATSTNAVASIRLSPKVIASAARQSRSSIDQRRRQLSVAPKCHRERSAAIPQRHRPTLSPASDCPPMSLRPQRGNLAAVSTNAVASIPVCLQMSLRAQRGNLVTASTNAVASIRLSPNVIASTARQSRSRIDQRRRQHSIVPQCHCERSAAIPQRHRPTLSPASDCPQCHCERSVAIS